MVFQIQQEVQVVQTLVGEVEVVQMKITMEVPVGLEL
jgi:hypothetical protein